MSIETIKAAIRDVPDFPEPGIVFKDITPVLNDPVLYRMAVDILAEHHAAGDFDKVVGIEARGFIFGSALAYQFDVGFVPVRKQGKLPAATLGATYDLEYGTATVEIHKDAIVEGERVLIVDDLLATGGTAAATASLIEEVGGKVIGIDFLIELAFLKGRDKLSGYDIFAPIVY